MNHTHVNKVAFNDIHLTVVAARDDRRGGLNFFRIWKNKSAKKFHKFDKFSQNKQNL